MDETLSRINELLKTLNNTFELSAEQVIEEDEGVVCDLKIKALKSDGSEFVGSLFELFNVIVQTVSEQHEVVYTPERGLVIAKKVLKTDYIFEDE